MKASSFIVAAALAVGVSLAGAAQAATLYDNGPLNGLVDAYTISSTYAVTNSFTLTNPSTLTSATIGAWVVPGDAPNTLDWSIGTTPYGSDVSAAAAVTTANTFVATHSFVYPYAYDDYEAAFPISGTLPAGTYYLTLQNATTVGSGDLYWDENFGPSTANANTIGAIASESFQISGSAVPEPASLSLLGLAGAMLLVRRRRA